MLVSDPLSQFPLQLSKPDLQRLLQSLQPGQLLKGTVVQQVSPHTVQIRIGTQELLAHTRLPLTPGQPLAMKVEKGGERPELVLLQGRSGNELQRQLLRQALPRQIPQAVFFNTLQTIAQGAPAHLPPRPQQPATPLQHPLSAATGGLSPELQKAIQAILSRALSQPSQPSAVQVRQAFLDSGLFLESNLLAGNTAQAAGDLKAQLLVLAHLLRRYLRSGQPPPSQRNRAAPAEPTPASATDGHRTRLQLLAELFRQTEGSLARLQTHQLHSLPAEDASLQAWRFELPVQQPGRIDSFLIRLERERKREQRNGRNGATWRISLHFDFSPLGPVEARLSLQGEEVSAFFLAEQADSATLLERHLPHLNEAFARAGLKVGRLLSQQGTVSPTASAAPAATASLLDERA